MDELGTLVLVGVLLSLMVPCLFLSGFIIRFWAKPRRLYYKLKHLVFWSATLTFFFEGYISFAMYSIDSAYAGLSWDYTLNKIENVYVILLLAATVALPPLLYCYFTWHK